MDIVQTTYAGTSGYLTSEGPISLIDFDHVEFTGSFDTVAANFGTLSTGGSGTINISLVDFSVKTVFTVLGGTAISFIYNNFGYDSSSVIYVKNMFFGGNITTGLCYDINAFNRNLNANIKYQFINYSHHSKMKFDTFTLNCGYLFH